MNSVTLMTYMISFIDFKISKLKNNNMAKSVVVKPTQYSYRTKSGGIVTRTRKAHSRKVKTATRKRR
jgi:hypothetical protein